MGCSRSARLRRDDFRRAPLHLSAARSWSKRQHTAPSPAVHHFTPSTLRMDRARICGIAHRDRAGRAAAHRPIPVAIRADVHVMWDGSSGWSGHSRPHWTVGADCHARSPRKTARGGFPCRRRRAVSGPAGRSPHRQRTAGRHRRQIDFSLCAACDTACLVCSAHTHAAPARWLRGRCDRYDRYSRCTAPVTDTVHERAPAGACCRNTRPAAHTFPSRNAYERQLCRVPSQFSRCHRDRQLHRLPPQSAHGSPALGRGNISCLLPRVSPRSCHRGAPPRSYSNLPALSPG